MRQGRRSRQMVQLGLLTAEAAGLFVAPGAPGPFPAAFPAGNALVDASSASIISCNAERGDCIVEGCRPRRARRLGEGDETRTRGHSEHAGSCSEEEQEQEPE